MGRPGHYATWVTGCLWWAAATAQVLSPPTHPLPSGIQATLYESTAQTGRPAAITSIHRLVGLGNRLFVALSDAAGHEIIDVWDTRNLSAPRLISSLHFGSVQTNGVMFTPLTLVPFHDGLLLQTRSGLSLYRFQTNGQLTFDQSIPTPGTGLGLGPTQIHVAGHHGSLLQQVIPNHLITADNLNRIHRQVLLNLANPEDPKLLWAGSSHASLDSPTPVNTLFQGHPASLGFDPNANRLSLVVFQATRPAQQSTFWMPKLRKIFTPDALDRPLRDLLQEALSAVDLTSLQARGVRLFAAEDPAPDTSLPTLIQEHHFATTTLKDVFAQYGIATDDPLELALAKVIAGHLDPDLEAQLSREWYTPALQSWLTTLLAPDLDLATAADTTAAITAIFNTEIDEHTLARYLTLHVISPMIGQPDFMELTLGEVLDQLAQSPAGEMIDVMLRTAGGFGALNGLLDSVRGLLDLLPGVDLPRLPTCAQFPDSTEQLLELALFSWNDAGAGLTLDRDGLAWFELLKFYRYLSGHTDFPDYTREINQQLRQMQSTLGHNLAGRISGALALVDTAGDLPSLQAEIAGELQARLLIGRLIAHAVLQRLPGEDNFTPTMTTRAALNQWGLRVQQLGYSESRVSDLLVAMQSRGLADLTLAAIFEAAETLPADMLATEVEQVLRRQVQASFGLNDLDSSLLEVLAPCLDYNIGLPDVMGQWMGDLLNELLTDGPEMSNLMLNYRRAFEHHDCVAGWLVVLEAIGAASAAVGGDLAAQALEYALQEGYSAAVGQLVNTLFGALIDEIIDAFNGNEPTWIAAQLKSRAYDWAILDPLPGATTTTLGVFAWQSRVGAVVQQRFETNWFGPRTLWLVLCHPEDPAGTRQIHDLGRWQSVNYVNHHQGAVLVNGSFFTPTDGAFPSGKALVVDLDAIEPRLQRLHGDPHLPLASAPRLAGANHEASLAVGGLNRVYLLPHPAGGVPTHLQPAQPPRILSAPQPITIPAGGTGVLTVHASGTAPLRYQWLKDGSSLQGATESSLTLVADTPDAGGEYSVTVSNRAGSVLASATATVLSSEALRIIAEPTDIGRFAGQTATFTVSVECSVEPAYQWFHGGHPVPAATLPQLVLADVCQTNAGDYHLEIRHADATLRSRTARLDVLRTGVPGLLAVPTTRLPLGLGTTGNLTSSAVGWGDLTTQWFKDGSPIAGATSATLPLGPVTTQTAGEYQLQVRDAAGNTSTHTFTVVPVASATMSGYLQPDGQFAVQLANGVPGQNYQLQTSTDLTRWSVVQSGSYPEAGAVHYLAPAPSPGAAYFRIESIP